MDLDPVTSPATNRDERRRAAKLGDNADRVAERNQTAPGIGHNRPPEPLEEFVETDPVTSPTTRKRRQAPPDHSAAQHHPEAIVREPECRALTGLSRPTRWRLERAGLFPKKRQLSPGCKGWLRSEIQAWIAERAAS
jgi:predicted DNA-binding transcriptional regulator AlpA